MAIAYRAGRVALIGKPNVGKSTLTNLIVGQKVSITSNKPQTTRRKVIGIHTTDAYQIAFVDTPGIHDAHTTLGKSMIDQARRAFAEADVIVFVADGSHHPGEMDERIAEMVRAAQKERTLPVVLCLNKMDMLKAENVARNVEAYSALFGSEEYMLTTATRGQNVDKLIEMIVAHLPVQAPLYPREQITDQSERFLSAELVREKILQATRQEVPHATAVLIDDWVEEDKRTVIAATILVEKASQRAILIGKQGQFIKKIGMEAREEIEKVYGRSIRLDLHVKVAEDWRMSRRILHELEYDG